MSEPVHWEHDGGSRSAVESPCPTSFPQAPFTPGGSPRSGGGESEIRSGG